MQFSLILLRILALRGGRYHPGCAIAGTSLPTRLGRGALPRLTEQVSPGRTSLFAACVGGERAPNILAAVRGTDQVHPYNI